MTLREYFDKGITYEEYMTAFEHTVASKRTSGPIQTEELAHYTELNFTRSKRIFKHSEIQNGLLDILNNIPRKINIICLTEFWCGDAAQNNPVIQLMANNTDRIEIRYLFRDENVDLMDQYLTNGGRSIPKYILLNGETNEEIANWGPRPTEAQQLMQNLQSVSSPKEEMAEGLQRWYNADKTNSIQNEWILLLSK